MAAQKTAGSKIGVSETQVSATHAASLGYKAQIEEAKPDYGRRIRITIVMQP